MNRKLMVLAGGMGLALMGFGEPAIKDRSVLGWWRFDSEGEKDVSGYGGCSYDLGTGGESARHAWYGSTGRDCDGGAKRRREET